MATCQTGVSYEGHVIIRLQNASMSVTVLPQFGGKIYNIVDLRTGRDWLWKNPHIALQHPSSDMDYDSELDSGGWDEILFSVKPSVLELPNGNHFPIGDHGKVVERAWTLSRKGTNAAGEAICDMFAEGKQPNFRLDRKIIMAAEQPWLDIKYSLTNTGQTGWPWFWCAHPLLAVEEGMQIKLEQGQEVRFVEDHVTEPETDRVWPIINTPQNNRIELHRIFEESVEPETYCQKLYVRSAGEICLRTDDGSESFCMSYDPESLPWLGLWINKNARSGCDSKPYLNLGIEPATSPYDKLSDAVASGEARFLQPGESTDWSLSVKLGNVVNTHD